MKPIIFTLIISFIFSNVLFSQKKEAQKENCLNCKIPCMCKMYFKDYLDEENKRKIIKDNWNDFFAEDLSGLFQMPKGANIINIKFDGMGCIYPENNTELKNVKNKFLGKNERDYRNFDKHTFYNLFNMNYHGNEDTNIQKFIKIENFTRKFQTVNGNKDIEYFDFIRQWNEKHIPNRISEINNMLNNDIKKVVFFIHGYNVPYSLANLQTLEMMKAILDADKTLKVSEILLINVFWPSGNRKRKKFKPNKCNYNNIETPKTAYAYTYYSNRAYLGAVYLRRILREVNCKIPFDIITHSHGSALATTALINTFAKMQSGVLSDSICNLMEQEPFPKKQINVFLNAPSIPGMSTFTDIVPNSEQINYRFFVGFNRNDIVLKKQKLKLGGIKIKQVAPTASLSSTTLGCDKKDEVNNTIKVLDSKNMGFIFKAEINSTKDEHDFFCYVKQEEFMKNLKKFLEGGFR